MTNVRLTSTVELTAKGKKALTKLMHDYVDAEYTFKLQQLGARHMEALAAVQAHKNLLAHIKDLMQESADLVRGTHGD